MIKQLVVFTVISTFMFCAGSKAILIHSGKKQSLHRYAEFGRIDKIHEEHSTKNSMNFGNQYGYTPLMIVATASFATKNHIETFNYLLKHGAHPNTISNYNRYNTVHLAALNPHVLNKYNYIMLEKILTLGTDINAKNTLGQTPLLLAIESFDEVKKTPDLIKKWITFYNWLIKNKAKVNTKDNNGNTPLSIAAKYNNQKLIDTIKKSP